MSLDDTQRIWIAVGLGIVGLVFMVGGGVTNFSINSDLGSSLYLLGVAFGVSSLVFFLVNLVLEPSSMK